MLRKLRKPCAARRWLATSAQQLRQQEDWIRLGLRGRLPHSTKDGPEAPARVAVSGRHSSGFAAALRAIRHEAIAAPVDSSVHGAEELTALFAEARIQLAVLADASASEASNVQEAARRLGASTVCANTLAVEGSSMPADAISEGLPKGSESSMLLFAHCSTLGSSAPRAAEVDRLALSARISRSTVAWEFCAEDTVLSLGLEAGSAAAVVDAMEAPLASGARVVCSAAESVWDLWSAIDEAKEASVAFVGSEWCWSLAKSYSSLAAPLRESLRSRFREKPFRHFVAAAPAGTVLSQDLAARWREIFNCPLTWHFSCAEAGTLYTVCEKEGEAIAHAGYCADGLQWRADEGELRVKGDGIFTAYHGRPRSTREAFDEDGFFCKTGHRALNIEADMLLPLPSQINLELEQEMHRLLSRAPNQEGPQQMRPNWKIKKVPIRIYNMWVANWGGMLVTKKHNPGKKADRKSVV